MTKARGIYEVRKVKIQKQKFIEGMLIFGQQRKAAEYASKCRGKSATNLAQSYLQDPWVRQELARREAEALEKAKLTANDTMASMARDLKFDPSVCFDEDGNIKSIHDIPAEARLSLRGYKRDKDGVVELKFPEKTAVREQAMKHFGLYERDNKQKPFYMPPEIVIVPVEPRRLERKDDGNRS